jgi:hypothetical protein
LFEAGALTKFQENALCSLLLGGLSPTDVSGPLSQFQNRRFEKNDFRKLVYDINNKQEKPLEAEQFDILFETIWPRIDADYQQLLVDCSPSQRAPAAKRSDRELLEEILFRLRGLERVGSAAAMFAQTDEELLDLPVTYDSLRAYTERRFPGRGYSEHWQNALLREITSIRYPTLRHIDNAVNQAMPAVQAYKEETPETFLTGTDFITKGLGFVDSDFRGHHSFSARTLNAFEKYKGLVKA